MGGAATSWLVRLPGSGSSGSSSGPDLGDCVVILGQLKAYNSHSASLLPGVQMCRGEFNAGYGVTLC